MENISKVYALIDDHNRVIRIEGGFTMGNIQNINEWIFIDAGFGSKFDHCQNNYLDKPLVDDRGIYRYKLDKTVYPDCIECDNGDEIECEHIDYDIVERTELEMELDYDELNEIAEEPTQLDRVAAQALYTALMTDTLIEEGSDDV